MHVQGKEEDIRTGERRPFLGVVQVSWQTRSGETRVIRAKCIEISDQGARIECENPIDLRTRVYLQAPAYGLMGNASVRHCRRSGIKHIVGLLFSSPAGEAEQGRKRLIRRSPGEEKLYAN
ncbi:MAG: hypothetical protein ABSG56_09975 [Bryobacteraceae bacterium]|jgi:hypothetical protein